MNLDELKQYLEENQENQDVQKVLNKFVTVSNDNVESYLNTDEGKRYIQPKLDRYHNKSLETWKSNNLEKLIDEEVQRRNPEETEAEKRIRKLEEELENRDKKAKHQELQNKAYKIAQEKGLPTDLVDYFIGEDEESTQSNLDKFSETLENTVTNKVDARFKQNGREFNDNQGENTPPKDSTIDILNSGNIRN